MKIRWFLAWGALLLAFLAIFSEAIFQDRNFAYRDTASFYYPLFQYVQSEWDAGRVPLWNPYQNGGEPLAANATASVWYPLKLLFFLPLDFDASYKLYLLSHVVIAAVAMAALVRAWQGSIEASTLAGLSYALGANVMFQHVNVVFLCGAAWLPLAALFGMRLIETRNWRWAAGLGAVLALMVTAGDPQMAYQAGLLVALFALIDWSTARRSPNHAAKPAKQKQPVAIPWRSRRSVLLAMAALWAGALSAVQLLPAIELTRRSDRGYFDVPRSLLEIPAYLLRDVQPPAHPDGTPAAWHDGLRGRPPRTLSHTLHQYDFSVAPWRLAELVWPNISGRPFPEHRRWLDAAGDSGFWSPSLYLGVLPLVLALSVFTMRRGDARWRWLSWITLIGVFGSFGSFGLGWLLRHLSGSAPETMPVGDAFGGVHWLFSIALPGFVEFRFPGKLMVITSLGLAGLAAHGWDRLIADRGRFVARGLASVTLLSLSLALAALAMKSTFVAALATAPADGMFGPLNVPGAWRDLCQSLLHTAACGGLFWWLLRGLGGSAKSWRALAIVPLCALDLAIANGWMAITAPAEAWHGRPALASLLKVNEPSNGSAPARFYAPPDLSPAAWSATSDSDRAAAVVAWQRDAMMPNFHLSGRRSATRLAGTTILFDYEQFMSPAARQDNSHVQYIRPRRAFDAWGSAYFVLPQSSNSNDPTASTVGLHLHWLEPRWLPDRPQPMPEGQPLPHIHPPPEVAHGPAGELNLLSNVAAFPRAWIVHDMLPIAPLEPYDVSATGPVMQSILFPDRHWIDLQKTAVVEHAELAVAAAGGLWRLAGGDIKNETCRILEYQPNQVVLDVETSARGLVVLSDTYYPGWTLEIETEGRVQPAEILKTNRLMRGALVPAGRHRLTYRYRSGSFRWGAAISASGLLLLGIVWVRSIRSRKSAASLPAG